MPYPEEAQGFQVDGPETYTEFHKRFYKLKPFGDYDVDVKIEACGVCGSDVHTISGGWGEQKFPLCVGHEIIGRAIRVGPKVTLIKEGERVGVGAQSYSCGECKQCRNDNETYCPVMMMDTYGSLVRNGAGPGKKVGIVGLGGIGHFGIMFAKALGAETWAISRSRAKEADARKLGADGYIATAEEGWEKDHRFSFDLIINCANSSDGFDLAKYLSMMDVHGRWVSVGLPEEEGQVIKAQSLISNGVLIGASHLGSRREMLDMLQLAADKGLKGGLL